MKQRRTTQICEAAFGSICISHEDILDVVWFESQHISYSHLYERKSKFWLKMSALNKQDNLSLSNYLM